MGNSVGGVFQTFYALFMVSIVLFLAYIVTRFIGKKYMRTLKGKNIKVIESISMGLDKMLYLVKVGEQYFLLSSSGKNINNISEIDASSLIYSDIDSETSENANFSPLTFAKYLGTLKPKFSAREKKDRNMVKREQRDKRVNISNNADISNGEFDKNLEKIRGMFNNIKTPDKNGVE